MAPEVPQEGWYRDPVDPTRRRWWDGKEWSAIVAPAVTSPAQPAAAPPAAAPPAMADGTVLPYAPDASTPSASASKEDDDPLEGPAPAGRRLGRRSAGEEDPPGRSRSRVLLMVVCLVASLATAAIVYVDQSDTPSGPVDVAITVPPTSADTAETTTTTIAESAATTEPPATTEPTSTTEPVVEPEAERVEAPSYRDAYDACQLILDDSSIGRGGMDYQTFGAIDAEVVGPIAELRFEATDAAGATEVYLCRTLFDGDGDVMVGRLYLDLQNVLAGG
jgi:Protein of unknown function (DUF2510)